MTNVSISSYRSLLQTDYFHLWLNNQLWGQNNKKWHSLILQVATISIMLVLDPTRFVDSHTTFQLMSFHSFHAFLASTAFIFHLFLTCIKQRQVFSVWWHQTHCDTVYAIFRIQQLHVASTSLFQVFVYSTGIFPNLANMSSESSTTP